MKNMTTYLVEDSALIRQSLVDTLEELTHVQEIGIHSATTASLKRPRN